MRCQFIYSPDYYCDIGAHVFPTVKFRLVYERLTQDADIPPKAFVPPEPCTAEDLALVHTPAYLDDLFAARVTSRTIPAELPISRQIVDAFRLGSGGTVQACECALEGGIG